MKRIFANKKIGAGLITGLLACAALLPLRSAQAQVSNYASSRRQIRACVLAASQTSATFPPYAFYVLDSRLDLKPGNWDIVNPLAPANVTGAEWTRWGANANASTDGSFQQGGPLAKNMAAYWETDLSAISDDDLRKIDIALLPMAENNGTVQLSSVERERLRRFVDGGGTLWIELDVTISGIRNFFMDIKNGSGGGYAKFSGYHPLLNFPNALSDYELYQIAGSQSGAGSQILSLPQTNGTDNVPYMANIIGGTNATIAAGDYGAGHIIVSTTPIAANVFKEIGNNGRNLRNAPKFDSSLKMIANMIAWTTAAPTQGSNARHTNSTGERIGSQLGQKWYWNPSSAGAGTGSGAVMFKGLVFYLDSSNVLHVFDRDPASSAYQKSAAFYNGAPYNELASTAPLGSGRWSTPTVASAQDRDYLAVTSDSGETQIYAFTISSVLTPVPHTVLNIIGKVVDFNMNDNPGIKLGSEGGAAGTQLSTIQIPAPVYSEGLFFAVTYFNDTKNTVNQPEGWRVVALDPTKAFDPNGNAFPKPMSATNPVVAPSADSSQAGLSGIPNFLGPLTAGYIQDISTGALDKIIYCPTLPIPPANPPALGQAVKQKLLTGIWFGTKNEPLDAFPTNSPPNSTIYVPQRGAIPWYIGPNTSLQPVIHITYKNNGVPTYQTILYNSGAGFKVYFNSAPRQTNVLLPMTLAAEDEVYADYTLNWAGSDLVTYNAGGDIPAVMTSADTAKINRSFDPFSAQLASTVNGTSTLVPGNVQIIGGPAISAQDLAIFNASYSGGAGGNTGRVYGLREQSGAPTQIVNTNGAAAIRKGTGTQVAWSFSPEPSFGTTTTLAGGLSPYPTSPSRPSRLFNTDPYISPIGYKSYLTGFTPVGSPAISNDTVYVVGTTMTPPAVVVMALRANPAMTITIGANPAVYREPDTDATPILPIASNATVKLFNRGPQGTEDITAWFNSAPSLVKDKNFSLDLTSANITIYDCTMSNNNVINLAEPVFIGISLPPATSKSPARWILIDPNDTSNSNTSIGPLDNMAWFLAVPNSGNPKVFPFHIGNPTSGPSVIGDTLYFNTDQGIASVDLRGAGGQHTARIYNPSANPDGSYPSPDNSDSNLRVHLLLPGAGGSAEPPTGTERTLAVGVSKGTAKLPQGLYVMDARPTLIADSNRLLEVDYGGNALWSLEATTSYVIDSLSNPSNPASVTTRTNLARPGVAHRIGLDEFFIADTNNNRVTLADRGGNTLWELTTFKNDMGILPQGFPVTLNAPTDVEYHEDQPVSTLTFSAPNNVTYTYTGANPVITKRYLIADSGNFRLLEIVDVVDAQTGNIAAMSGPNGNILMSRQISFVSRTLSEQNLKYRYRTIQEFQAGSDVYIVSAIGNTAGGVTDGGANSVTTGGTNVEGLGGSIEILHRDFTNASKDGQVFAIFSSLTLPGTGANAKGTPIALNGVTFCKGFYETSADKNAAFPIHQFNYQYMIADKNGCYVVNSQGVILWMLTSAQYQQMTGRPLRASSIQRLPQSDLNTNGGDSRPYYARYLITNRYDGPDFLPELTGQVTTTRGQIHGEVFEIRSLDYFTNVNGYSGSAAIYTTAGGGGNAPQLNLGNQNTPIKWLFPNERVVGYPSSQGNNYYRIERGVGNTNASTSTYLPQQPTYAERTN